MTVKYTDKIASQGGFGSIFKLILRWRGSVYKMVWRETLMYLAIYYTISLVYRFALPDHMQRWFEQLVIHISAFRNLIPVSFVLGFYVSLVVDRWWGTYKSLPWPDTASILVNTHIAATDGASREHRKTILRYINATIALTFADVSPVVREKYEDRQELVTDGYLTQEELRLLDEAGLRHDCATVYVPIMWACKLVDKARWEGRIKSGAAQKELTRELLAIRSACGAVIGWNNNNIPLVYTQVVTIAVYMFFLFSLIGEQYIDPGQHYPGHAIDLYFPLFGVLQLVFYMGWIKVAEALLNPFGDDEHDFELIPLLERHLKISSLLGGGEQSEIPCVARTDGSTTHYKMIDQDPDDHAWMAKTRTVDSITNAFIYNNKV